MVMGVIFCGGGRVQTETHSAQIYKLVLLNILKPDYTKERVLDSLDILNIKLRAFETSYGNIFRPVAKVITKPRFQYFR